MSEIILILTLIIVFGGLWFLRYKVSKKIGRKLKKSNKQKRTENHMSRKDILPWIIPIWVILIINNTNITRDGIINWTIIVWIIARELLKRPIYIGIILFGIYSLVRFIKRSRNKE